MLSNLWYLIYGKKMLKRFLVIVEAYNEDSRMPCKTKPQPWSPTESLPKLSVLKWNHAWIVGFEILMGRIKFSICNWALALDVKLIDCWGPRTCGWSKQMPLCCFSHRTCQKVQTWLYGTLFLWETLRYPMRFVSLSNDLWCLSVITAKAMFNISVFAAWHFLLCWHAR